MHYSLNKTLKLPIRCRNLNKFACKYRFYWLSEGVPLFKLPKVIVRLWYFESVKFSVSMGKILL